MSSPLIFSWLIVLSMKTVIHPLLASSMTMFYSCFCVCCSSLAKLLSCSDVDCVVEAILLLMLSLVDSDTFRCRDRAASTLHTIALVGICFGVAERSVRITVASFSFVSGMGKMSLNQFSSSLLRFCSLLQSFQFLLVSSADNNKRKPIAWNTRSSHAWPNYT